ncbi:hypothetical protein AERO9A_420181 [Aeromonas salmonicida]|nr:hypothetical protein AERO9A_420181 [Aeromonas salmonicida]
MCAPFLPARVGALANDTGHDSTLTVIEPIQESLWMTTTWPPPTVTSANPIDPSAATACACPA